MGKLPVKVVDYRELQALLRKIARLDTEFDGAVTLHMTQGQILQVEIKSTAQVLRV